MSNAPLFFTVVIPLYNKAATIERAIKSVLNQTVQDFEIVVVNDGSTDKGLEIVSKINDPRIRLIAQENQGVSAARNRGIEEAKHELIAFLDADDEWLPEFLETISELVKAHNDCDVFATGYFQQFGNKKIRVLPIKMPDGFHGKIDNFFFLIEKFPTPIHSSAIAVRRTAILSTGGFCLGVYSGEDLLMWATLGAKYAIAYASVPMAIFNKPVGRPDMLLPRLPQKVDYVSNNLLKLLNTVTPPQIRPLKRFIAKWYRMRATCYLRHGLKKQALYETSRSFAIYPFDLKPLLLYMLIFLPRRIWGAIIKR